MSKDHLTHLIFDIETLGKRENTVIAYAAVVPFIFEEYHPFEYYLDKVFSVKFSIEEQIRKYKHTVSEEIVDWWKKQNKEVRDHNLAPSPKDVTLVDGLVQLSRYIGSTLYDNERSYVFSRGSSFDFPKIEYAYEVSANMAIPYNTFKIRDIKTLVDIMAGTDDGQYDLRFGKTDKFIKHDCAHDVAMDAARMTELYHLINEEDDIPF